MTNRIRRALLFIPGDRLEDIQAAAAMGVDSIVFDLEDSLPPTRRAAAHATIQEALREIDFGLTEKLILINPVRGEIPAWLEDIQETLEGRPDGYIIPKVESPNQVRRVAELISRAERRYGWMDGSIRLLAIIETALGIANLRKITRKNPRLAGLIFGAEDLAADLGATRTPDGWEVFYARSAIVTHARAYGLQAIDSPFVNLTADDSMLVTEAEQAHYMGYTGKIAIHPDQVGVIQRIFTPSIEQLQRAARLLQSYEAHQQISTDPFIFEGRLVDQPMLRSAHNLIIRAQAAGVDLDSIHFHQEEQDLL